MSVIQRQFCHMEPIERIPLPQQQRLDETS
jgi:hypothetical protein